MARVTRFQYDLDGRQELVEFPLIYMIANITYIFNNPIRN